SRRGRSRVPEKRGARGPAGGVVGVDVRHVDELLDDVVEASARMAEDGLQALEGALRLWAHATGDELAVSPSAGKPGGEEDPRGIDADPGDEAPNAVGGAVGKSVRASHL